MTESQTNRKKKVDLFADIPQQGSPDLFSDLPEADLFGDIPEEKGFFEGVGESLSEAFSTMFEADKEIGRIAASGPLEATQSVLDLVAAPDTMGQHIFSGMGLTAKDAEGEERVELPDVTPETAGGKIAAKLTQFAVGFIPAMRVLKAGQIGGRITQGAAAAAATDFFAFPGHEGNVADLGKDVPVLGAIIPEFMISKEDDTEIEGRMRNAMTGIAVGGVIDSAMLGLKGIRAARQKKAAIENQWGEAAGAAKNADSVAQAPIPRSEGDKALAADFAPPSAAQAAPIPDLPQARPMETSLTPEQLLAKAEPDIQARASGPVRTAGNINLDRIETPEDVQNILINLAREQGGFAEARKAGAELGRAETLARRKLNIASAAELNKTMEKAIGGSDAELAAFLAKANKHIGVQAAVAGRAAESSASLRAHNEIVNATEALDFTKIRDLIEKAGGRDMIEDKALLLSQIDDLETFGNKAGKIWKANTSDKVIEYWINALLSGPATHMANLGSNAAVAAISVPERFMAGALGMFSKNPDKVFLGEGVHFAAGQLSSMWEATKQAGLAAVGREGGAAVKSELRHRAAIKGNLGSVIRTPTRFLQAGDVWFKAINYGGELQAQAYRMAKAKGLKGEALSAEMKRLIADPTDALHNRAWRKKEESTFTIPLRDQKGMIAEAGKAMKGLTDKAPAFKLIAPFVQTPVNVLKWSTSRTPLGLAMKDIRDELFSKATSKARKQEIMGQMALGSAVTTSAVMMATDGTITGSGPSDPNDRRMLRTTGWQPYSAKIGDKYYSFARMEPLGTLLGMAADAVEISKAKPEGSGDMGTLVFAAFLRNIKDKTFLQGISALAKAAEDPERFGGRYLDQVLGSAIPNIAAQTARTVDPVVRDARNTLDRMKVRIGMGPDLQAVQTLWGEDIRREGMALQPIYISTIKDDKVSNEMVRLEIGPEMPDRKIGGVELTAKQYVDYVKLAGIEAKKELDSIVSDRSWKRMKDWEQVEEIKSVIRDWRADAREAMFEKYPELETAVELKEDEKFQE